MPLKTPILQLRLHTPPPSPDNGNSNSRQHHSRLALHKFPLRTRQGRWSELLAQNGSSTEGPSFPRSHKPPSRPAFSAFRTVKHMKEPFPLVLPASPASSNRSADERNTHQRPRKISLGYQNLCRHPSNEQFESNTSKPHALLPSPVFSELQTGQILESYLTSYIPNEQQMSENGPDPAHPIYEDHNIVSSYYDEVQIQTCHQNVQDSTELLPALKKRRESRRDVGIVGAPSSFPQYRNDRPGSCSSEANWLAETMSEKMMLEESLSDLHSSEAPDDNQDVVEDNRHEIMHATRLTGAGKPKVVTVSRPKSPSRTATSILQELPLPDQPSTPTRPFQEISVFSPDTPVMCNRRSATCSTAGLRSVPLTPQLYCRRKPSIPQSTSLGHGQRTRDLLDLSPSDPQDTFATDFSSYNITSPMRKAPLVRLPTGEAEAWSRCRDLEGTLDAVSRAIESFPDCILRLDSPAILALRTPHSLDATHIDALQRIFPQTASLLLSALAAYLIVDSYFSKLRGVDILCSNLTYAPSKPKYPKLAATSNECLHDIPTKARATLGIHLPNVTDLQAHERALRRRADRVAACVGIQGHKLLEALCGRFDEVIWTTLKVLVETLERNPS